MDERLTSDSNAPPPPSRRELLRLGAAGALVAVAADSAQAQGGQPQANASASPRRFGAAGDGRSDDRGAFAALDAALGAGIPAFIGDGIYRIGSSLTLRRGLSTLGGAGRLIVPRGVTLQVAGPILAARQQVFEVQPGGRVVLDPAQVTTGFPEWWGSGVAALDQCVRNCPITQLAAGDYVIDDTWAIETPYRTIVGAGLSDGYATGNGTRIICTNGAVDAVRVGTESEPGGGASNFLRNVSLSGFAVLHDAPLRLPRPGDEERAPAAFRLRYLLNARFEDLAAWEASVGFHCHGLVYSKLDDCKVFRSAVRGGDNDFFRGFWLDGSRHVLAGGNASLYLDRCVVEMGARPPLVEATGFWLNGGFVDCFLRQVETSQVPTGIKVIGRGRGTSDNSNLNLHIVGAVLDQCTETALDIGATASTAMVEIVDLYAGQPAQARHGVHLHNGAGQISFSGGQILGHGGNTIGFLAERQEGFEVRGLKLLNLTRSVLLNGCSDFLLEPWINSRGGGQPAVTLAGACSVGTVRPAIKGSAGSIPAGVSLLGASHSRIELAMARVDARSLNGGAANAVLINGARANADGAYAGSGAPAPRGSISVSGLLG
jgi:hypothetical protein